MSYTFGAWIESRGKGALTEFARDSGLSWSTVSRAKRGDPVSPLVAIRIESLTAGKVRADTLTRDLDGLALIRRMSRKARKAS